MIFGTKAEWKDTNPVILAVHSPYFIFDTFEIMSFRIFYILEVEFESEEGVILGRLFLIDCLERVFELLNDSKTKNHRLFVFDPRRHNECQKICRDIWQTSLNIRYATPGNPHPTGYPTPSAFFDLPGLISTKRNR